MCKEMPVIVVDRVVDKKRIIGKNGGPRRRHKGSLTKKIPYPNLIHGYHLTSTLGVSTYHLWGLSGGGQIKSTF
jgi:hypothetical protein